MRRYLLTLFAVLALWIAANERTSRAQEPAPAPAPKAACDSCQPAAENLREATERARKIYDLLDETRRLMKALDDAIWADALEANRLYKEFEAARDHTRRETFRALHRATDARMREKQAALRAARQRAIEQDRQANAFDNERFAAQKKLEECNQRCPAGDALRKPRFGSLEWLFAGAGAAGLGYAALSGGDDGPAAVVTAPIQTPTTTTTTTTTTNPPPAPPSPPAQPTADSFNGQYGGNLTVTDNACRFTPSAGFAARLNVDNSGNGILEFTYLSGGQQQLYVFNNVTVRMNGSQGTFETETNSTQFGYRLIVQGMLSGNAFTGRISFFDSRPGNCHTGYVVNGTRQ